MTPQRIRTRLLSKLRVGVFAVLTSFVSLAVMNVDSLNRACNCMASYSTDAVVVDRTVTRIDNSFRDPCEAGWPFLWITLYHSGRIDINTRALASDVAIVLLGAMGLFAIPMAVREVVGAARPRRKTGFCACCGYCLEGNISGVCPECGSAYTRRTDGSRGKNEVGYKP